MVFALVVATCLLSARGLHCRRVKNSAECEGQSTCFWQLPTILTNDHVCNHRRNAGSAKSGGRCLPAVRDFSRKSFGARYDAGPGPNVSETSIVFIKVPKCSSSTNAGVARRVGSRHGHRTRWRGNKPSWNYRTRPAVYANHGELTQIADWYAMGAPTWRAFLWTVVREPLARSVSAYFHFGVTKLHPAEHSDAQVVAHLEAERHYLWDYLRTDCGAAPRPGDVDRLLDVYDLVGTVELFDETMVLLAARLGVPLGDVLSVSAKNSSVAGARDPATGNAFVRADESQLARVRKWAEKTGFEARAAADYALWRNASARVRRDVRPLGRELAEYRRLTREIADPCAADPRNFEEDQCLWRDNGCAQPCIDAGLARDPGYG